MKALALILVSMMALPTMADVDGATGEPPIISDFADVRTKADYSKALKKYYDQRILAAEEAEEEQTREHEDRIRLLEARIELANLYTKELERRTDVNVTAPKVPRTFSEPDADILNALMLRSLVLGSETTPSLTERVKLAVAYVKNHVGDALENVREMGSNR